MDAHKELNVFLALLHETVVHWDEYGQSDDLPAWFNSACGICDNWSEYTSEFWPENRSLRDEGLDILKGKFLRSGLDTHLPFNVDITHYCAESTDGGIWYNPQRTAWLANSVK